MTAIRKTGLRGSATTALAFFLGLAACQPLPHPFEDDRPPAALLRVRDMGSVAIAPVVGNPSAAAARLGPAMAAALLKHDIAASDKTTSLGSYQLYGRLVEARPRGGKTAVSALWRLYDAHGRTLGEHSAKLQASVRDWNAGKSELVEKLAALSAEQLAPLLQEEAPAEAQAAAHIRVAVRPLNGAPGDGDKSLANAVAGVLRRQDVAIVGSGDKADLYLDAEVSVTPAKANTQHVKIVWHVRRSDGAEIGTVGQENDVPKGMLDGPWGDLAYSVAIAAGDGLMQLVARGRPAPKS